MKRALLLMAGASIWALAGAVAVVSGGPGTGVRGVDAQRLMNARSEPGNWMTHGGTYAEQRFADLNQINADNVKRLGLAWYADLPTNRGQEATPIVVDGTMYTTTSWSNVMALDAVTGKVKWHYDPKVDKARGHSACALSITPSLCCNASHPFGPAIQPDNFSAMMTPMVLRKRAWRGRKVS